MEHLDTIALIAGLIMMGLRGLGVSARGMDLGWWGATLVGVAVLL